MESNHQTAAEKDNGDQTLSESPLAIASLSLTLSKILPSFLPKSPSLLTTPPPPNKLKLPTQASTIANLSLTTTITAPPPPPSLTRKKPSFKSTPLRTPLSLTPNRPLDPSSAAALRRVSIIWFRNDLRVHDNECLNTATNESLSVLPVYCFDPADYGKSSSGFDKTGPYRAKFLIESVSDLRKNLRERGSDLVVRVGKPETVLVEMAKAVGASAVYAHREVSHDEVKAEEKIEKAMKEENVDVKYFWGSTLYHVDDLPFKLEDMPSNYGGFRDRVQKLEIRKTIQALDQLKGLPSRGDVQPGDIPTLMDLGLNPSATMSQEGKQSPNASMAGGETEAIQRLTKFAAECKAQPYKGSQDGAQDSIYGANFSCKISPWLAMGCLSPRAMFDELNKTASSQNNGGSGSSKTGTNWLMFELLWRDFFRFITNKYSSAKKQLEASPATGCTSAVA